MYTDIYFGNTFPSHSGVPGLKIKQRSDVGTILLSFEPAAYNDTTGLDAGEPPVKRWNFAISQPATFGGDGERPDRVLAFGYNIGVAAGGTPTPQEDNTDASWGWTIEDYYNLSTTLRQFEFYFQSCPAGDDGTGQVRPMMIVTQYPTLASNTAPTSGVFFDVDESQGFNLEVKHSNAGSLTTRTSDSAGTVTVTATHKIMTNQIRNLAWAGGSRSNVRIGAVSGTGAASTVAFSGGSGSNLPVQDTAIEFLTPGINWGIHSQADGMDIQCSIPAGAGFVFDNNSRGLKALGSTGTPKDMMYLRYDDNLVIAEGGILAISVGGLLKTNYGMQTMHKDQATIADTDFTGNGSETPAVGAFAFATTGGVTSLWAKGSSGWKSIALG